MNLSSLKKGELAEICKSQGLSAAGSKVELIDRLIEAERKEITEYRQKGNLTQLVESKIRKLAKEYSSVLGGKIENRREEMKMDDNAHYLIYQVLGISTSEGQLIDEYQNTGRFLYKYAGAFLEEAATVCLFHANPDGGKTLIPNTEGKRPKTFEIDFLDHNDAIEIKWRDATTDGDHITKEHTRLSAVSKAGYTPIRVMFYYPLRSQAIKIQETLKTLYKGEGGKYYAGDDAWNYIYKKTGFNLLNILQEIAEENKNG